MALAASVSFLLYDLSRSGSATARGCVDVPSRLRKKKKKKSKILLSFVNYPCHTLVVSMDNIIRQ